MQVRARFALSLAVASAVAGGALVAGSAGAGGRPPIAGYQLGVHYLAIGKTRWPSVPYGTIRLWDNGFTWRELQPRQPRSATPATPSTTTCTDPVGLLCSTTPGSPGDPGDDGWDHAALGRLDTVVKAAHDKGKQVVLVLGESPDWAVQKQCNATGQSSSAFYSPQASCAPDDSSGAVDGALWSAYVKQVLSIPHGVYINALETWNEANFPTYYNGTPAQLAQLTAITRQAVRDLGRRTAVLTPSIGARHPNAPGWLRSYLSPAKAYGMPFDAVAVHLYPTGTNGPETMLGPLDAVRSAMAAYGVGSRPVWDTEVGAGYRPKQTMRGDDVPGRVIRTALVELSAGVKRMQWYAWNDTGFGGDPINSGNNLTAAGVAFRTVYGWTVGNRFLSTCHKASSSSSSPQRYLWICDLALRDGSRARVVWNTNPKNARLTYTAPRGTTRLYGWNGHWREVSGGYRFSVGAAPVLLRGSF
jgi:hypothetical protein